MSGRSKRLFGCLAVGAFVACVAVARTGAQNFHDPFIDHGDNGEIIHVLPTPASVRSPHDTQPTEATRTGTPQVFAPSYGSGNLNDHGGPEIAGAEFRAIYWNSSVAISTATPNKTSIQSFIGGFARVFADGQNYSTTDTSADYTIIQQYGSSNQISALLPYLDADVDSQLTQRRISDSSIQNYLAGLFNAGKETAASNVLYGIYFPSGMRISLQGGSSCTSFCGYHSNFTYNGIAIKYAVFPYPDCAGCSLSGKTIGDMLTIVTSHEIREAVTDSLGTAWWDSTGYEADDKCAWHNLYQTTNGSYWVQPEYSNGGASYPGPGCVVPK
jgi:hypothetical protein